MTWVFGLLLFATKGIVFQYMFALLNTAQVSFKLSAQQLYLSCQYVTWYASYRIVLHLLFLLVCWFVCLFFYCNVLCFVTLSDRRTPRGQPYVSLLHFIFITCIRLCIYSTGVFRIPLPLPFQLRGKCRHLFFVLSSVALLK